jgi:hypothetical protein
MFDRGKEFAVGDAVAAQLIGHDHARHILKAFQRPSKESFGGFGTPPRLNEDVEHDAALIHGTPKIALHSLNPDEHLVHVPLVAGPRPAAAQAVGKGFGRTSRTADVPSHGKRQRHVQPKVTPQAEAEHVIQPDSMADDLGGKVMPVVRVGRGFMQSASSVSRPSYRYNPWPRIGNASTARHGNCSCSHQFG